MYICNERPMYISHIYVYGHGTHSKQEKKKSSLVWKYNYDMEFYLAVYSYLDSNIIFLPTEFQHGGVWY